MATGVPGLDTILAGGLLRRSTSIVQGPPGSGKTVLANQMAFHKTSRGGRVLYITLAAESHSALLRHISTFQFYDPSSVGDRLFYLSGFRSLRDSPSALVTLVQQELVARRPGLLIIDGITSIQELHGAASLRQFLHDLLVSTETANCTGLLISATLEVPSPEDAVVDTVLHLSEQELGPVTARELRVNKSRGSAHVAGRHAFVIDQDGITIYPRIEALHRWPSQTIDESPDRVRFEHDVLDEMLGGGVRAGSSTLVLGSTGTGKTLLGLSFLAAGLRRGQTAMYAGLYEGPARLIGSAESIGLGLQAYLDGGQLILDWQTAVELLLDAWAHRVLETVRERRPTRLFVDGLSALAEAGHGERLPRFLTAFLNELRALGVTTMTSAELRPIIGAGVEAPLPGVSAAVENTILLRYVEVRSHLYRIIAVVKVRGSSHQTAMREFQITAQGFHVASTFQSAEDILSGSAKLPARGETDGPDAS
jgi:circadian clock protein KaiC